MKSSTRLDSAIFQLTPTRTRCDLVITANGKTEKIASGLLNPFCAHLKTAQDQIAKGGYSILLEPGHSSDTTWFTKGTVERFVRFVSTPEILERVYTVESEILQIEEAIAIQGNNDVGLSTVDDCQSKPVRNTEGSKFINDANEEKAIVPYKPDVHPPEANGSIAQEGNSKYILVPPWFAGARTVGTNLNVTKSKWYLVQLLKVLEARKTVLQKEQGMAFARAVAAGFEIDHMAPLVSFAECFGASRLMDACLRFVDLWKRKHETGQWLEIEAAEAITSRSGFSPMKTSGIMLSSMANKQNQSQGELASENNGQQGINASADERRPIEHHIPIGQQECFQGQFPQSMFSTWPVHAAHGTIPFYQPYPLQGMPYYQNYPGNGSFYQSPYPPVEDPQFSVCHRAGQKRHSMDNNDGETELEAWEMDATKTRSQGGLVVEKEASDHQGQRKKAGRSDKKHSGMVVIRNINYITSKMQNSSGSETQSASGSETDEEAGDLRANAPDMMHKNSVSLKRKGTPAKSMDQLNLYDKEEPVYEKDADGEHWQAFQNFLLRDADEQNHVANNGMFASETNVQVKRRLNALNDDPLTVVGRDPVEVQGGRIDEFHKVGGNGTRLLRSSKDEVLISRGEGHYGDGRRSTGDHMDVQFTEINGRKVVYRRTTNEDFMIVGRENQSHFVSSSDPLAQIGYMNASNNLDRSSPQDMTDESFIVPFRSMSLDQAGTNGRTAVDMDSEIPATFRKLDNSSNKIGSHANYEPDDLSLMPERRMERRTIGYDSALDYDMQVCVEDVASLDNRNKEEVARVKQGSKKSDKDWKSKASPDALDKKKTVGPIRKGRPSKMSPLDDARARAERLRTFKADLQKMKKEKEEEDQKRLEALKIERQKRIAARGSSTAGKSSLQTRKQLPSKLSLNSHRGSKFSDSEPGSSSPLQRSKIRTASLGSSESQKPSKTIKSSNGSHLPGNRLTRSVPSLPELRKENSGVTPDSKASMARIRRLSEPKTVSSPPVAPVKRQSTEIVSKPKVSNAAEVKKISAIIKLDRSKAETLPELKIRTSKGNLDVSQNKSTSKEMTEKVNGNTFLVTSGTAELNGNSGKTTHQTGVDDNPIIEKTVVMLQSEKPSIPVVHALEQSLGVQKDIHDNHDKVGKIDMISDYVAICAPPSPIDGVDIEPTQRQVGEKPRSYEVKICSAETEPPKTSSISTAEKSYQAPLARLSSIEDSCTGNAVYGKAPSTSLETGRSGVRTARVQESGFKNLKLEKIPEVLEKSQVKDFPKGFRRLLKFGRKNNSSAAGGQSDNASVNDSKIDENTTYAASSNEVHKLKNLIYQDEASSAGSSKKSSRHFSLLSPFRSKTAEKNLNT